MRIWSDVWREKQKSKSEKDLLIEILEIVQRLEEDSKT